MNHNQPDDRSFEKKIIEVVIKISVLFLLIVIAVQIVYPFLMPIAWGMIIAVAVEPLVRIVAGWLGGRRKIVATLFAVVTIGLLLIASLKLASTSVEMAQRLSADLQGEQIVVPPPPDAVQTWPIIGEPVYETWNLASSNLAVALEKFGPQLRKAGLFLFDTISGGIGQLLLFIISIAISAAFLATAERSTAIATRVVSKFAGTQGEDHRTEHGHHQGGNARGYRGGIYTGCLSVDRDDSGWCTGGRRMGCSRFSFGGHPIAPAVNAFPHCSLGI
jgi:predicted PurR-regulated permease PerM